MLYTYNDIIDITDLTEIYSKELCGLVCSICKASNDKCYVLIDTLEYSLDEIVAEEDLWSQLKFEIEDLCEEYSLNQSKTYIVFLIGDEDSGIPIQKIESSHIFGKSYVFKAEEAITFINGIVMADNSEVAMVNPADIWIDVLSEVLLTGCLTENYLKRYVEDYLDGKPFESDSLFNKFTIKSTVNIPSVQRINSLVAGNFRPFCFDGQEFEFEQVNIFHGANGSGKSSILEAIEYALTGDIYRLKDFKVKLAKTNYPQVSVSDNKYSKSFFNPKFSDKYQKEIEKAWYGVPIGRNKSTLPANFNRFNSFNSETVFKFIRGKENSDDDFAQMFGNLLFGDEVVEYEKKSNRFKVAFIEKYEELKQQIDNLNTWIIWDKERIESSDLQYEKDDDIEEKIENHLNPSIKLPDNCPDRYNEINKCLKSLKSSINNLSLDESYEEIGDLFDISDKRKKKLEELLNDSKDNIQEIQSLTKNLGEIDSQISNIKVEINQLLRDKSKYTDKLSDWESISAVLKNESGVTLFNELCEKKQELEKKLEIIHLVEQKFDIIRCLEYDDIKLLSDTELSVLTENLKRIKEDYETISKQISDNSSLLSAEKHKIIELRVLGKNLSNGSNCPLCGHKYSDNSELIKAIDSLIDSDSENSELIEKREKLKKQGLTTSERIKKHRAICQAYNQIKELSGIIDDLSLDNWQTKIKSILGEKDSVQNELEEINNRLDTLNQQGISIKSITQSMYFQNADEVYAHYRASDFSEFAEYLSGLMRKTESRILQLQESVTENEKNKEKVVLSIDALKSKKEQLKMSIDSINSDPVVEIVRSLESIAKVLIIDRNQTIDEILEIYEAFSGLIQAEIEKYSRAGKEYYLKEIEEYESQLRVVMPKYERCKTAVDAFNRMPSLVTFVEKSISSNIHAIGKFFTWIHHSGEFSSLNIDHEGIYAIRRFDGQYVRVYEMSTGQRTAIALSVLLALYSAAKDSPKILLLDEPLATMDNIQSQNVMDILKSFAENGTQIFFTTSNNDMIEMFRKYFSKTSVSFREFEFVKRINETAIINIKKTKITSKKTSKTPAVDDKVSHAASIKGETVDDIVKSKTLTLEEKIEKLLVDFKKSDDEIIALLKK